MPTLLVIDDESSVRISIKAVFSRTDVTVLEAETAEEGVALAAENFPGVVLLDIKLGAASGLDVFSRLRRVVPRCLVIFITGFGTAETAIEAMKLGAFDYLTKPLDAEQLQRVVQQALAISQLANVPTIIDAGDRPEDKPDRLIGSASAIMQAVCKQIGRVAPQDVNVLVLGESGTGKELVARAFYHHSRRSQAAFLAINCAAISESLLESELFGHERGAFTGADQRRIGKFEQCHGGTLFLDEVGDMAPHTQAKILRLLQEGRFERVGGNESLAVNVRIIAATNQDLPSLIQQGRFRKDLYYRLCGVTISLPPLRQRQEDIAELAHYFLFRYNRQLDASLQSISPEALELLQAYSWPGNVRELQNVIRQAILVAAGPTLLPEFLPAEIQQYEPPEAGAEPDLATLTDSDWQSLPRSIRSWFAAGDGDVYRRAQEIFDRLIIHEAMQQAGGNRSHAGKMLGLSHVTLRAKLRSMEQPGKTKQASAGSAREPPNDAPE